MGDELKLLVLLFVAFILGFTACVGLTYFLADVLTVELIDTSPQDRGGDGNTR